MGQELDEPQPRKKLKKDVEKKKVVKVHWVFWS
jgi:hypothetical protein